MTPTAVAFRISAYANAAHGFVVDGASATAPAIPTRGFPGPESASACSAPRLFEDEACPPGSESAVTVASVPTGRSEISLQGSRDQARELPRDVSRFNGVQSAGADNFPHLRNHFGDIFMDRRTPIVAALLSALCCLASASEPASLYSRLGGTPKVTAIVDATVDELAAINPDNTANEHRDLQTLKNDLVARICWMTGGGCRNPGALSAGFAGADAAQPQLLEALRVAMRVHDVPLAARNELLEVIAPVRRDVASR